MTPVVRSLLETDLYKFTMWQALLHGHPNAHAEYEFVCRNQPSFPLAELKEEVEAQLDHLCRMSFTDDELDYLRSLRYIKSDFVDFLAVFRFQRKFVDVRAEGGTLVIHAEGPQVHVMATKSSCCTSSTNCISAAPAHRARWKKGGAAWATRSRS
jgi:nicotinate phosphoribosyltransferase